MSGHAHPETLDAFGHGSRRFARALPLQPAREHLERGETNDSGLINPSEIVDPFAASAASLQRWRDNGRPDHVPPADSALHDGAPATRRSAGLPRSTDSSSPRTG